MKTTDFKTSSQSDCRISLSMFVDMVKISKRPNPMHKALKDQNFENHQDLY